MLFSSRFIAQVLSHDKPVAYTVTVCYIHIPRTGQEIYCYFYPETQNSHPVIIQGEREGIDYMDLTGKSDRNGYL